MTFEKLFPYLAIALRYGISMAGAGLVVAEYLNDEQAQIFVDSLQQIVGAVAALAPLAYALWKRPSSKAMKAARAIDKSVAPEEPVVIQTPEGQADIKIAGAK